MTSPALGYDAEGVRRVARTLLRHVRPSNRNIAFELLTSRLGSYVPDRSVLWAEIDHHFGAAYERRVA